MQDPEQLPSGRWRGVARDPHYRDPRTGKKGKRHSQTFDSFTEAAAWAEAEERRIDEAYRGNGIAVGRQQHGCPLLADYALAWAGAVEGERSTRNGALSHARAFGRHWPTQRVDEITRPMLREYLRAMASAGLGAGTREQRLSHLRRLMATAVEAGHLQADPTVGVKGPAVPEHQARILTEPELMLMLACLPGWLWPAALLSHDAGPRIQEIAGLRMHNLNLLRGTITIAEVIDVDGSLRSYPKSKIIRDVPLSARTLTALRTHVQDHPPAGRLGHVFAHPVTRQRVRPARIRSEWDRALELAQLDGRKPTWHDLRHGCATTLAESGASPFVIQAVLGHASVATSQRYVRKANLSAQRSAVEAAFGGAGEATAI